MPKAIFKTDQEWFELIQLCRTSGLNDKEFCREYGISQTSLYRHIKKLRAKAYEIPIASEQKHEVVPIEVADPAEEAQAISVEGSGGMDIVSEDHQEHGSRIHIHCGSFLMDIDSGADHRTLRDTLSILQKLC